MDVTVIIPYKKDRGWLKEAVASVPANVQLILSQGDGNWPQNFNKALPQATGKYIKYLHEDDILASQCIENSILTMELSGADFIHGDVMEFGNISSRFKTSANKHPTLMDLLNKNTIFSPTLMYKREIFDIIGGFNESKDVYSFEEFEFNLRVLKAGFKIGYCNNVLAFYRRHPNQIIRTVDIKQRTENRQKLVNSYK